MVELEITLKDKKIKVDLAKLKRAVGEINTEALKTLGSFAVGISQAKYLQGPRPEHLGTRSTRLIGSMQSEIKDDKVYVGTNARSNEGFNYPQFWETKGRPSPRPFLKPLVTNEWDRLYKIWFSEMKKEMTRWLEKTH